MILILQYFLFPHPLSPSYHILSYLIHLIFSPHLLSPPYLILSYPSYLFPHPLPPPYLILSILSFPPSFVSTSSWHEPVSSGVTSRAESPGGTAPYPQVCLICPRDRAPYPRVYHTQLVKGSSAQYA